MSILLVDDEPHVRTVLALKLRDLLTVHTASNGQEGFDAAKEHSPALIISDFHMPLVNGIEMCRFLASEPSTSKIPVIMVTSREFELTDRELAGTNIRRLLSKPFSPRSVLRMAAELLGLPVPERATATAGTSGRD